MCLSLFVCLVGCDDKRRLRCRPVHEYSADDISTDSVAVQGVPNMFYRRKWFIARS